MERHTDVLLALREQVLRIAEAARRVRSRSVDDPAGWLAEIDGIMRRADVCRQLIDGQIEPPVPAEAPQPRSTAVAPVLAEAIAEVDRRGLCARDAFRVVVDGDPVVLPGRETLRRILTGLLADACQHARVGTPVDVAARNDVVEAHIEVTHQSDGADSDRLHVVLTPSPAADAPDDDAFAPGTALNLRLVRALVGAHGGYLEVEHEGAGVTVTVCLPSPVSPGASADVIDLRARSQGRRT